MRRPSGAKYSMSDTSSNTWIPKLPWSRPRTPSWKGWCVAAVLSISGSCYVQVPGLFPGPRRAPDPAPYATAPPGTATPAPPDTAPPAPPGTGATAPPGALAGTSAPPPPPGAGQSTPAPAPGAAGGMIALDAPPPDEPAPSVDVFYATLGKDGHWEDRAPYGRLWSPSDTQYEPYRNGRWQWTDYGWTWIAEESFGWAVNHYGRWLLLDGRWLWKPDVQWGPSQVDWRSGGDYVGWAPAIPPSAQPIPGAHWKFILARDLGRFDLVNAYISIDVSVAYAASQPLERYTRTAGGEVFIAGPDPAELQQRYSAEVVTMALPAALTGRFQPEVWQDPVQIEDQRQQGELAWRQVADEQLRWQGEQRRIGREQQAIDAERGQLGRGGADPQQLAAQRRALDNRQRGLEQERQANLRQQRSFASAQLRQRDEQRSAAQRHATPDLRAHSGGQVGTQPPPRQPARRTSDGRGELRDPPRPPPQHLQPPHPPPQLPHPPPQLPHPPPQLPHPHPQPQQPLRPPPPPPPHRTAPPPSPKSPSGH
jgi:hypothetical protein